MSQRSYQRARCSIYGSREAIACADAEALKHFQRKDETSSQWRTFHDAGNLVAGLKVAVIMGNKGQN